ncbi:MAG: VCBS repeat-containing protein [Acidobacteria bacterium]|nr:VCBS repeat-containing protein [Acidobacteriota bacterium]
MTKRFFFVVFIALTSFLTTSAQSGALRNDLGNSFRNVDVVRLNARDAIRRARSDRPIALAAAAGTFELAVAPHDLRAARYTALDTGADGLRPLDRTPVTTYKGKIVGTNGSEVRLTMDETGIEGYFSTGAERYFIEPAARYSKLAAADEFVVYRAADVLRDKSFICPQDLAGKMQDGEKLVWSGSQTLTANGLKAVEIATEADSDFVASAAGPAGANAKILSILNMVEGVYETDLGLTISVVFQHTWTTPDPFNGATTDTLLNSFQSYWNANFPLAQYARDTAHLFSYKPTVRAQGYAFLSVVCGNRDFAYGLSGRVDVGWGWEEANFLVTSHEIAHNLGATHSDAVPNCANTLMNAQLSGSTQMTFCSTSRNEITSYVVANGTCLTPRSLARFDYDGDGKTDVGIFRPAVGEWWLNRSSTGVTVAAQFGNAADRIASGDFTGDGKTDIAIFRPSNGYWFVLRSEDGSFFSFPFGAAGDIPEPADYDGDGKTDAAVFRPSNATWYISQSGGAGTVIAQFGATGDLPVTADYDGDGKSDIAIFRPSNGEWWLNRSTAGTIAFQFGSGTDKCVPGDYTGDGKADIAFFRPATGFWYILRSENFSFFSFPFGTVGDVPAPGDYDGDGKFDPTVYRPSNLTWYISGTAAGTTIVSFGATGDSPLPNAFVP